MSTATEVVDRETLRKKKAVEAQQRYRKRLKEGTNKLSKLSFDSYKLKRKEYMILYRDKREEEFKAALKEYDPSKSKVNKGEERGEPAFKDTRVRKEPERLKASAPKQPIQKPIINDDITPKWKQGLPSNATPDDIVIAKRLDKKALKEQVDMASTVFRLVLEVPFDAELKGLINQIFEGYNIVENAVDMRKVKKYMPFLSTENKVIDFVNKVQNYYNKSNLSLKTKLVPFVNILGRLGDKYNKQFQILSKITSDLAKQYSDERDKNRVLEKDRGKIFDFNPESVKKAIDRIKNKKKEKEVEEKALAACYSLQPPRRLEDFQYMVITNMSVEACRKEKDYNFLIMVGDSPSRFVYSVFKTFSTFGTQDFAVSEDIKPYLMEHLKVNNLFPLTNKRNYIFGSTIGGRTEPLANFSTKLTPIFQKMYGEKIGDRWIRASAATRINNRKDVVMNLEQRKEYARMMAHSRGTNEQYEKVLDQILEE